MVALRNKSHSSFAEGRGIIRRSFNAFRHRFIFGYAARKKGLTQIMAAQLALEIFNTM